MTIYYKYLSIKIFINNLLCKDNFTRHYISNTRNFFKINNYEDITKHSCSILIKLSGGTYHGFKNKEQRPLDWKN